jgi:hypothetical protein
MRPSLACLLALLVALGAVSASGAAEAPGRPEYVKRLETICKPGSEATQRAVRGVKAEVRAERLRLAAPKVVRAKSVFAHTVSLIAKVPRPPADRPTLARWFATLRGETTALGRTAAALRADDVALFERAWSDFVHAGARANNVVVSFGFDYCAFKSTRFE